ncbi:MAG: hypothetical protein OXE94_07975 [Aestuariivita sp.]|nr:hypothetical protein [Aestuariivita sp.]MCY4204030.1 hypothetical protein [Aestuariivita sp.]MCY4289763.1 hypothetical protein [Aestuariivita sp.]MCY4347641.1 hypothetical protein [Aestuariivita sp.]
MTIMPHETDLSKSRTPTAVDQSPAQDLEAAGQNFVAGGEELGLSEDVAELFRETPLAAEQTVREMLLDVARAMLQPAFAALDDQEPPLTVEGKASHRVDVTHSGAMNLFGPVDFGQSRYRPLGNGAAMIPTASPLGLTTGGMAPAAGLSMYLMYNLRELYTKVTVGRRYKIRASRRPPLVSITATCNPRKFALRCN